jgi:hypothetical protein
MASVAGFPADPTASSANVSHNFVASWDTTALADGFYTLRLRVTDDLGNVGEDRLGLWVPALDSQAHAGQPQSPGASSEPVPGSALADLVRGALLAAGRLLVGAPDHG